MNRKEKEREISRQKLYLKTKLLRKTGVKVTDERPSEKPKRSDPFAQDRAKFDEKQKLRAEKEAQIQAQKQKHEDRKKERAVRGKQIAKMKTKSGQVNLNLKVKQLLNSIQP